MTKDLSSYISKHTPLGPYRRRWATVQVGCLFLIQLIKNGFSLHPSSTWCMGTEAGVKGGHCAERQWIPGVKREKEMPTQLCPGRHCWKFPSHSMHFK